MNILFLVPYPSDTAPSQRFRFEQYLDCLSENGHSFEVYSFWGHRSWSVLYHNQGNLKKLLGIISGYWGRLTLLTKLKRFDRIFIHREATPLGIPWMEWYIKNWSKNPIIYDFDDAIWMYNQSSGNRIVNLFKRYKKVKAICHWSYKISCGNSFLAAYAQQFNPKVKVIPTTIDTNYHRSVSITNNPLVIGWTGSHSTLPYLSPIIDIIQDLQSRFQFVFQVICDHRPEFDIPGLKYLPWSRDNEIEQLNLIDIGIMPLPKTEWTKGKCGFKILQYMALEKAAVASAVGVNTEIIEHGHNGLLCYQSADWLDSLSLLLSDKSLRNKLGTNGRATVERQYSKTVMKSSFLSLFE